MNSLRLLIPLLLIPALFSCNNQTFRQGEALYLNQCANCHMEDGAGLGELIPPLAGSDWLREHQRELPCLIRYGMEGPIVVNDSTYNQPMPGVPQLTEFEIANIINYINQAWGNEGAYMNFDSVKVALERCSE